MLISSKHIFSQWPKILLLAAAVAFVSCFKEDEQKEPHTPGSEITVAIQENIYHSQVFVNLLPDSIEILQVNGNADWHLGFETGVDGWHVTLNSSNFLRIANTQISDFDSVTTIPAEIRWRYDKSNGNLDSTAIGSWAALGETENLYTNHVYLLGTFGGINYSVYRKFMLLSVDEDKYVIRAAKLDGSEEQQYEILKDDDYNFIRFSFENGGQIAEQPMKYDWDFMFSQYASIVYTIDSVPTEYTVRGALINHTGVEVAEDRSLYFRDIVAEDVIDMEFSNELDVIGADWKAYIEPDYVIDTLVNYIIRDNDGLTYKLKFIGYYSEATEDSPPERGYPTFEYKEL